MLLTVFTPRARLNITPQRIKGKLEECDFFLKRMGESDDLQEFGYHFSAFLSAFGTFTQLALIRKHGKTSKKAREQLKKSSRDVELLLSLRDVEVHREGVSIWIDSPTRPEQIVQTLFGHEFGHELWGNLFLTRAFSERITAVSHTHAGCSFVFHDSGEDVTKTCRAALEAARSLGD